MLGKCTFESWSGVVEFNFSECKFFFHQQVFTWSYWFLKSLQKGAEVLSAPPAIFHFLWDFGGRYFTWHSQVRYLAYRESWLNKKYVWHCRQPNEKFISFKGILKRIQDNLDFQICQNIRDTIFRRFHHYQIMSSPA